LVRAPQKAQIQTVRFKCGHRLITESIRPERTGKSHLRTGTNRSHRLIGPLATGKFVQAGPLHSLALTRQTLHPGHQVRIRTAHHNNRFHIHFLTLVLLPQS
jgi:hypothetical protein